MVESMKSRKVVLMKKVKEGARGVGSVRGSDHERQTSRSKRKRQ
jgi:hypothetical protein